MNCCKLLRDGVIETLPFQRAIATGFYDGPVEGFTECAECRTAYAFRKLDWDDLQNVRVTGFAPLDISLDTIATRLRIDTIDVRRLPLIPPLSAPLEEFVKELLAHPPIYVAAIKGSWPGRSQVWRSIQGLDLESVKDWFAFLEISRRDSAE